MTTTTQLINTGIIFALFVILIFVITRASGKNVIVIENFIKDGISKELYTKPG